MAVGHVWNERTQFEVTSLADLPDANLNTTRAIPSYSGMEVSGSNHTVIENVVGGNLYRANGPAYADLEKCVL